ncbi:Hypothetical_protein [Hexamita inflata]|uniref:Hypothetical_protein n=1 Tax=Hexamita inflata TaxID=28002 RepID=A0AA86PUD6_9EUKA|nr:Hypothetical protein HINF_LOCUS31388 [Hexamita inflata]
MTCINNVIYLTEALCSAALTIDQKCVKTQQRHCCDKYLKNYPTQYCEGVVTNKSTRVNQTRRDPNFQPPSGIEPETSGHYPDVTTIMLKVPSGIMQQIYQTIYFNVQYRQDINQYNYISHFKAYFDNIRNLNHIK